ncbi:hypothetical protein Trydic_g7504 [Trypoxylus dichotomus]
MSFPNKAERAKCWGARDEYWECLDKHKIQNAEKGGLCAEFRKVYEMSCSSQWVKHFDRKRSYLQYKEKIEKDGIPNHTLNQPKIFEKRRVYTKIVS